MAGAFAPVRPPDMVARLIRGGEPTERQGAWLGALFAKLKRAARQ